MIRIESSAALLAEHDRALGRDELGRVRLDRRRVVELARDRAALAPVERLAGHRLPRLELVAGQLADALGDRADPVEPEVRLDAVERSQRQRDLAEVRVAGALAHPVDRPLDVGRAGAHGRDRARGRDAEVVVAVEVNRDARADELDRRADELGDGLGRGDAERVDDDDLLRARPRSRSSRRGGRSPARARVESTPKNAAWMPCSAAKRIALVIRSSILSRETPIASSFRSEIGDSITEKRTPSSTSASRSAGHRAREAPDLGLRARPAEMQLDRVPVVGRDAREPGLDPVDAELVEQARDLELLLGVEHDADGLLAVAQRRVVEADVPAEAVRVVQRAGPDQRSRSTSSCSSVGTNALAALPIALRAPCCATVSTPSTPGNGRELLGPRRRDQEVVLDAQPAAALPVAARARSRAPSPRRSRRRRPGARTAARARARRRRGRSGATAGPGSPARRCPRGRAGRARRGSRRACSGRSRGRRPRAGRARARGSPRAARPGRGASCGRTSSRRRRPRSRTASARPRRPAGRRWR